MPVRVRLPSWLADLPPVRRALGALAVGRARRQLVAFDREAIARSQQRILLGLVHQAQTTRFGRDHDFRRICGMDDFRRLVPLRTPAALWRDYWQLAFPRLGGATWPGPISDLAVPELFFTGPLPCVPVPAALREAFRAAAWTALAFASGARPLAPLFDGRLLLLGAGTSVHSPDDALCADSWEVLAARVAPVLLRTYFLSTASLNGLVPTSPDARLEALARRSLGQPVTCLAGTADRLLRFFDHLQTFAGRRGIAAIWPQLVVVLYAPSGRGDRARLESEIGGGRVLLLEACFCPEGPVALEDPRQGGLRLLTDHGMFFEFVPMDQLDTPNPTRLGAAEVEPGVPYALAVSSPAGVWACLLGTHLRFTRCDPLLVERIEVVSPAALEPPRPAARLAVQPPHLRSGTPLGVPLVRSGQT